MAARELHSYIAYASQVDKLLLHLPLIAAPA